MQNEPDAAVEGNVSAMEVHLLLRPVWMQQGECWALGKGVNGRTADFPLISSAEAEFLCVFCVLWLFWFGISITELACCQIWEDSQSSTWCLKVDQDAALAFHSTGPSWECSSLVCL